MDGADANLKPKEFALLFTLIQSEGSGISAKELYEAVWNMPAADDTRTVKAHIYHIRKKLSVTDYTAIAITNEYGTGYRLSYTPLGQNEK
jgi:DNA-binding response OmpR family regulator